MYARVFAALVVISFSFPAYAQSGPAHWVTRETMITFQAAAVGPDQELLMGDSRIEMLPPQWTGQPVCGLQIVNGGIGGIDTTNLMPLVDPIMQAVRPAYVVLNIGVNDAIRASAGQPANPATVAAFPTNYDWMARDIMGYGAHLALTTIYPVEQGKPLGDAYFDTNAVNTYNAFIRQEAVTLGVPLVDGHNNDTAAPYTGYLYAGWSIDGVHLEDTPPGQTTALSLEWINMQSAFQLAHVQAGQPCP